MLVRARCGVLGASCHCQLNTQQLPVPRAPGIDGRAVKRIFWSLTFVTRSCESLTLSHAADRLTFTICCRAHP